MRKCQTRANCSPIPKIPYNVSYKVISEEHNDIECCCVEMKVKGSRNRTYFYILNCCSYHKMDGFYANELYSYDGVYAAYFKGLYLK